MPLAVRLVGSVTGQLRPGSAGLTLGSTSRTVSPDIQLQFSSASETASTAVAKGACASHRLLPFANEALDCCCRVAWLSLRGFRGPPCGFGEASLRPFPAGTGRRPRSAKGHSDTPSTSGRTPAVAAAATSLERRPVSNRNKLPPLPAGAAQPSVAEQPSAVASIPQQQQQHPRHRQLAQHQQQQLQQAARTGKAQQQAEFPTRVPVAGHPSERVIAMAGAKPLSPEARSALASAGGTASRVSTASVPSLIGIDTATGQVMTGAGLAESLTKRAGLSEQLAHALLSGGYTPTDPEIQAIEEAGILLGIREPPSPEDMDQLPASSRTNAPVAGPATAVPVPMGAAAAPRAMGMAPSAVPGAKGMVPQSAVSFGRAAPTAAVPSAPFAAVQTGPIRQAQGVAVAAEESEPLDIDYQPPSGLQTAEPAPGASRMLAELRASAASSVPAFGGEFSGGSSGAGPLQLGGALDDAARVNNMALLAKFAANRLSANDAGTQTEEWMPHEEGSASVAAVASVSSSILDPAARLAPTISEELRQGSWLEPVPGSAARSRSFDSGLVSLAYSAAALWTSSTRPLSSR